MPSFQRLFERQGLNFYPLFQLTLIQGAIGGAIPQCLLFEKASRKAQQISKPQHIVCFQEHFPQCRAIYAGVQGTDVRTWAIQHASYNQNKTFVALHAQKEFGEQQDGQSVPHPDRVCVMGKLGERIFGECGYSPENVVSSGSTRYEQVVLSCSLSQSSFAVKAADNKLNLLIATSLPAKADFSLVEAAVLATESIKDKISLRLRQHPFARMDRLPGYGAIAHRLKVSDLTLETDLAWADLVLISQSTVGEEAILAGKPVWQIRFPHPNQSALAEAADIPRFYTVTDLRQALMGLISAPQLPRPEKGEVEQIYKMLFQTTNKKPSVVIADAICV